MDTKTRRTMMAVLRVLHDTASPLGAERIAERLNIAGTDLSERAVRNYLAQADAQGWTRNLGRRGRSLTTAGRQELEGALVMDKVGFVAARVDALAYQMTFNLVSLTGSVILNISTVSLRDLRPALRELSKAFEANLGMGRLIALRRPGEMLGGFRTPEDRIVIGTLCSVSINGIFQQARIPTRSRFGGLLELEGGKPKRFTQIINYDGTSLDPLEIFIRGHMTSVSTAATTGNGVIGASFREVPSIAYDDIVRLAKQSEKAGLGGLLAYGQPNQPLLDVPVAQGCVGLIVAGGLNPVAAIVESGIDTTSSAMHTLCDFEELKDYRTIANFTAAIKR